MNFCVRSLCNLTIGMKSRIIKKLVFIKQLLYHMLASTYIDDIVACHVPTTNSIQYNDIDKFCFDNTTTLLSKCFKCKRSKNEFNYNSINQIWLIHKE